MSNLAISLRGQGQLEAAATMHGLVLSKRKQIFGADHQSTISAMSGLASTLDAKASSMKQLYYMKKYYHV